MRKQPRCGTKSAPVPDFSASGYSRKMPVAYQMPSPPRRMS